MNRMLNRGRALSPALFLMVVAGCASGGAGGGMDASSTFRMDVGATNTTSSDMLNETQDLLRREQFLVFRTDPPPVPLVESEWRNQTPFEDEQAQGIEEVRCKVIVRGRERPPSGSIRTYQVAYTMQVQVKTAGSGEWQEMPLTPQRRAMAQDFGRELRLALEVVQR